MVQEKPSGEISTTSRDRDHIVILGEEVVKQLADLKLFMIGAGAIGSWLFYPTVGCEMLKNLALLGVSAGDGRITLTDNDVIEKSNLNRQFLFRPADIKHPKSETAAKAVRKGFLTHQVLAMNPNVKIDAKLERVGRESEKLFSDAFFKELDVVVNALDNVNARLYVDSRCVSNTRPLLESGTLGTKGRTDSLLTPRSCPSNCAPPYRVLWSKA